MVVKNGEKVAKNGTSTLLIRLPIFQSFFGISIQNYYAKYMFLTSLIWLIFIDFLYMEN